MPKRKIFKPVDEWREQSAVITWANTQLNIYPELNLLFGNMNGVKLAIGAAIKAKRMGNKRGLPDLMLLVARKHANGLFIEMKRSDCKQKKTADFQKSKS